jgi:hypothetical protein
MLISVSSKKMDIILFKVILRHGQTNPTEGILERRIPKRHPPEKSCQVSW